MPKSAYLLSCLVVCVLLSSAPALMGQAMDGNIIGTVLDPSGAVIPNAAVTLENTATNVSRTTRTDSAGNYRFTNVLVGDYTVTVQSEGFASKRYENVRAVLNRSETVNVTLEVGDIATQIVVSESAASIDTTTATIGSSFNNRAARYTPGASVDSLGVLNLSLLGAGVSSSGGTGLGEGPSVGGQRPRNNNFTVEGVDNNRKDVTGRNVDIPNEAVAEFSMLQNQVTAEFGRSTGGQFNTVIRSGSNELHGSLFEYFENRKLNAVDEADARQGIRENPRYDSNRFGGAIGGPIVKNKLFYFGTFQFNPIGAATPPLNPVLAPTSAGFGLLDSIGGLSQTNLGVLKQYVDPAPQASGVTTVQGVDIPIGVLPISFPTYENLYSWLGSVDYNWSDMDQTRFRYVENRSDLIDATLIPRLPAFSEVRNIRNRFLTLAHVHTFSPTVVNETRLSYSRYSDIIPAGDYQYPGLDAFPNLTIEQDLSLQLGPTDTAPQSGVQNTYQIVNNTTWTTGAHTFKFGIDGRKYIAPTNFIQRVRGDYNYATLERFLLDLSPDLLAERNTGGVPYDGNQIDFYWYVQDDWKVTRNLTLNLGLRHEYKGIPAGDKLQALNAISNVPGVLLFDAPKAQTTNFAPRVGLAYSPGDSGKTVFRAGFGMAYDNYFDNLGTLSKPVQLENTLSLDPSDEIPNFLANGGIRPDQRPESFDEATARAFTSTYIPDQRLPYSIQWSVGVERVFGENYTATARYLGTRGLRLFTQDRINVRARVTADRHLPTYLSQPSQAELDALPLTLADLRSESFFLPQYENAGFESPIVAFSNRGNSVYHGLALELKKRFSSGIQFIGAYTWSHNIDDSTADLFSTLLSPRRPQDFQNMRAERSSSFLDRRHRFTWSWVYEAPWLTGSGNWFAKNLLGNWVFAGTYAYESPQFATVQSGTDSNLNGDSAGDRAIINPSAPDKTSSDVTPLTNSAGDVVGYLALNPNSRYIKAGQGAFATGGRQTLATNPINNFDVNLTKAFSVGEAKRIEIGATFFNVLNHPQFIPGSVNSVKAVSSNFTNNNLIPGNPLFNQHDQVYDSNARTTVLVLRFTF
jgi:hypothetical protein